MCFKFVLTVVTYLCNILQMLNIVRQNLQLQLHYANSFLKCCSVADLFATYPSYYLRYLSTKSAGEKDLSQNAALARQPVPNLDTTLVKYLK